MEEQHKLLRMQEQTRTRMQGEAVRQALECLQCENERPKLNPSPLTQALRKRLGGDAGELGGLAVHATARGAAFADDAERNAAAADSRWARRPQSAAARTTSAISLGSSSSGGGGGGGCGWGGGGGGCNSHCVGVGSGCVRRKRLRDTRRAIQLWKRRRLRQQQLWRV